MAPREPPEVIVIDDDSDDGPIYPDHEELQFSNRDTPEAAHNRCKDGVKAVFPDICLDYLEIITLEQNDNLDAAIDAILNLQENGEKYPVRSRENPLKRKRADRDNDEDNDEDGKGDKKLGKEVAKKIRAKIAGTDYSQNISSPDYRKTARNWIAAEANLIAHFPKIPLNIIDKYLKSNKNSVFETYTAIDEAARNWDPANPPWQEKKKVSKAPNVNIEALSLAEFSPAEQAAIDELRAAREVKLIKDFAKSEEEVNLANAKATGEITECGCCFEEFPLNRMISCDGETVHWFCRICMKSQAEHNIGLAKHELTCMSMDGCSAGFAPSKRSQYLDKKSLIALERIEQEAALRTAGIENLETCPFCPYAAEYPPIAVNKEFHCVNPGCEIVSCRMCRKETHIPKTCAEAAVDSGVDARHILEEAMSEALIRKCNSCKNPFLKTDGCNKIKCTRCGALQCYVCRQTIINYTHFKDRGGDGKCPLYESTEQRHQTEVERAEEEARQRVARDNPDITADALKFKVSDQVQQDEQKRITAEAARNPNVAAYAARFPMHYLPGDLPPALRMPPDAPNPRPRPYRAHLQPPPLPHAPPPPPMMPEQQIDPDNVWARLFPPVPQRHDPPAAAAVAQPNFRRDEATARTILLAERLRGNHMHPAWPRFPE
ncbi:uncharacterized protein F4822DRAFT_439821 [Hypoxylon trugodes]|uniref:uncharacterized protein n=1 Tax=Hypoxylon trugodes TaxID=326681 RepID=UPI00219BA0DC|nr:uncharacterized protein F4822DRAFT_439821 [Hypoxylon trugodes]KAI1394007.1 hypothetical protein F4822DRAFT_439821 [Hypoxylon trugodes]